MKGGKTLLNLQARLAREAPLATLHASGNSSLEDRTYNGRSDRKERTDHNNYTWQVTASGAKVWPTIAPDRARTVNTRYSYVPDVPPAVLRQLTQQLEQAVAGMDSFYQAALQSLAPQLVMQVLDGKKVSWSNAFEKEINGIQASLDEALSAACNTLPVNTKIKNSQTFYHAGAVMGTLRLDNHLVWYQGTERTNLGSPITFYIALPQIAQAVANWLKIINMVAAEMAKLGAGG